MEHLGPGNAIHNQSDLDYADAQMAEFTVQWVCVCVHLCCGELRNRIM